LTGRQRQLCETVATYAEAEKALTRLQRQVDEDIHPKSDITVRQAIEQWLDVVELEATTRERYEDLIRLYVFPTFGHHPASRLDAELLGASTLGSTAAGRCAPVELEPGTPAGR
jgi:integrase